MARTLVAAVPFFTLSVELPVSFYTSTDGSKGSRWSFLELYDSTVAVISGKGTKYVMPNTFREARTRISHFTHTHAHIIDWRGG